MSPPLIQNSRVGISSSGEVTRRAMTALLTTRFTFVWVSIFFRAVLDISYLKYVTANYGYAGFHTNYTFSSYAISWVVYGMFLFITPHRLRKVSDYFFVSAAFFMVAPLSSMYGLSDQSLYTLLVSTVSIVAVFYLIRMKFMKVLRIPIISSGTSIAFNVSIIMVAILIIWFLASGAVKNFNLDLTKVYEFRSENAELTNIGVLAYINTWTYKVFNIFLMAYALHRRRYGWVAISLVAQIFFFGIAAHKSVLFFPVLVFAVWYYFRRGTSLVIIPLALGLLVTLSLALSIYTDNSLIASLLIRRVFYVPALLTYQYFDYFSSHGHLFWSDSVMSWLLHYPYSQPFTQVIGDYFGSGVNANNGYIASGYAQGGILGIVIYTFIVAFILKFLDVAGRMCGALWLAVALTVVPLRSLLMSSDLPTVVLTHGLFIAIILLLLVRENSWTDDKVSIN